MGNKKLLKKIIIIFLENYTYGILFLMQ